MSLSRVRLFVPFLLVLVVLIAWTPAAASACGSPFTLGELTQISETIAEIRVIEANSRATQSGARIVHIETDNRVVTNQVFKGRDQLEFTITQPGGTAGDMSLVVSHLPTFEAGDRAIVFIDANGVVGGSHGKLDIIDGYVPALGMSLADARKAIRAIVKTGDAAPESSMHVGPCDVDETSSSQNSEQLTTDTESATIADVTTASSSISNISPAYANGGVGARVTIDGSGFGSTQGTGKVDFLRGDSQSGTRVSASIVSWSSTRIVCLVPRPVQSGSVRVINSSSVAASRSYNVGFSSHGVSWAAADLPVTYTINPNSVHTTGERTAISAAIQTWNSAGSNLRFAAGGSTSSSSYPPQRNYNNEIYFVRSGMPTGALAQNFYWMSGSKMLESDIVFNDASYTWTVGASSGKFDIETVALHEIGHAVGLDDQYGMLDRAMGAVASGKTRRSLTTYEKNGAIHIYGPDGTLAPGVPLISSSTHPSQTGWSKSSTASFSFSANSVLGVGGYSYILDRSTSTIPNTVSQGTAGSASYNGLAEGDWYFHVRAMNSYGVWGDTAHYRIRIDGTPPVVSHSVPDVETAPVTVTVNASDALSGIASVQMQLNGTPYSGTSLSVTAPGNHHLIYTATDRAGNSTSGEAYFEVLPGDVKGAIMIDSVTGADRYETAVEASKRAFPAGLPADGARTVVIATGRNWPDALGGAGLAGAIDAPMLLVDRSSVPAVVTKEIRRLGAQRAIILGGTSAVDQAVQTALANEFGAASRVTRIAGADRYATADAVAKRVVALLGNNYDGTAVVATGDNYPDALAVSPLTAANGWPLYLTHPTKGLTTATLGAMGEPRRILVLGGEAAVSGKVETYLRTRFSSVEVRRLHGIDRYQTAVAVANYGAAETGLSWDNLAIATGQNFPDALAGGVLQGSRGSIMLLSRATSLCGVTQACLETHKDDIYRVTYLGGYGAVPTTVRDSVVQALE